MFLLHYPPDRGEDLDFSVISGFSCWQALEGGLSFFGFASGWSPKISLDAAMWWSTTLLAFATQDLIAISIRYHCVLAPSARRVGFDRSRYNKYLSRLARSSASKLEIEPSVVGYGVALWFGMAGLPKLWSYYSRPDDRPANPLLVRSSLPDEADWSGIANPVLAAIWISVD